MFVSCYGFNGSLRQYSDIEQSSRERQKENNWLVVLCF